VETGADIPTYLFGLNENVNNGAATQCVDNYTFQIIAGASTASDTWNCTYLVGTLNGATTAGSTGTCDNTAISSNGSTSDSVAISNVQGNGTCFDVDAFNGNSTINWSGRGSISADGKTVSLEVYLVSLKPTGDRCANGGVGATGVSLNGTAFTGNDVQVYRVQ